VEASAPPTARLHKTGWSAFGQAGVGWGGWGTSEGCVGGACPGLQMDLARGWRPQLAHAAGAAMNSSRREDALLMSPGGYLATSGVLFIIGFVGCFANLLVIVLFAKNKQVRPPAIFPTFNSSHNTLCAFKATFSRK